MLTILPAPVSGRFSVLFTKSVEEPNFRVHLNAAWVAVVIQLPRRSAFPFRAYIYTPEGYALGWDQSRVKDLTEVCRTWRNWTGFGARAARSDSDNPTDENATGAGGLSSRFSVLLDSSCGDGGIRTRRTGFDGHRHPRYSHRAGTGVVRWSRNFGQVGKESPAPN